MAKLVDAHDSKSCGAIHEGSIPSLGTMNKPKIVVIVGPTASGKTSLSIELALKFNGEIISADSRQVYRGLDLGSGKVTPSEMSGVPHHLLDVANPAEVYTVADYVRDGRRAVSDIHRRGLTPIIVGGTFLYIDALVGKVSMPEVPPNEGLRTKLEAISNDVLFEMLEDEDPERALTIDKDNKRRLIRALEIIDAIGVVPSTKSEELYDTLTIGIEISKEELKKNIHDRLTKRIEQGMIEEVRNLYAHGLSYERMEELGLEYRYIAEFLQGKIPEEEMFSQIEIKSLQYAKRQMTWLKRDKEILWISPEETKKIENTVAAFIHR